MPDSFELEMLIAAEPQRVFSAWLDAKEHAAFTGGGEAVVEPWTGGRFISWDGYIHGILLGVDAGRRIVQTWRTSEFPPMSRDSRLVVEFEEARGGTKLRIRHSDLPPTQVKKYEKGWLDHYLKPLARYFAKGGKAAAAKGPPLHAPKSAWGRKPERKPPSRKAAARKPAARKAAARKPTARKAAARKPAARKAIRRPVRRPAAKKKASSKRR